ncbi:type VI secretion system baseplate subunit TssE [Pseudomonas sp. 7P_10.2_Bac1]|uniref:type VI secretion system baseplate subunit TssE n=1 Tax=Pseudomonas sp. 7P_10.2_Bac1 TaxID=2971614 RepID=UPI0021CA04C6|nr:type VI secretion system baseplate subunit TssE [Pseudomonas sp. 7P_10.2_Bac1]MCU1726898.1 type VI secretion system baseplate subunit TssE [Pseudomonas sp. 7P_10.2_Bac1]
MASLFERLEPDAPLRQRQTREQLARHQVDAIKQHLERLLNARRGCSQSSPELGLSDFNGGAMGSADLVIHISADIRRSVEAFEPRIKVRGVRFQPNPELPLELTFRLDCQVRLNNKDELVQLTVAMHGQDRYTRVT